MLEAYRLGFRRPAVLDFDLHLGDATNLLVESLNSRRSRLRTELKMRGVDVPEPGERGPASSRRPPPRRPLRRAARRTRVA